ncbi:MAG TPA: tail fiber protein [Rhizomicrobium sp.]|nr:tail fiber protein [Rhizomicrobium sp.]
MFAGNFAPKSNAYCAGQLISIQQNSALFSLLGTTYGGNGTTTFGLPDLRGRLPVHFGQGAGLSNYTMGEVEGTESVTITSSTMPMHVHVPTASSNPAGITTPGGNLAAGLTTPWTRFWVSNANKTGNPVQLNPAILGMAGGNQPHENRMPAIAISMIVSLVGIFPSRN